jgi:hypothetical protein
LVFQRSYLALVIVLCLSIAGQARAAGWVRLAADSCFSGMQANGEYPIAISVQNPGPSTRGVIRVNEQSYGFANRIYSYPIDLPSGAQKKLIAYPVLTGYSNGVKIEFDGAGGGPPILVSTTNSNAYYDGANYVQIGAVGDNIGALEMVRTVPTGGASAYGNNNNQTIYSDCYCAPEAAPDRATGYSGLSELVVDAGSERLTDDQWDAIREWVVGGGSLILFGGAGSLSYLENLTVAQMLPLSELHEVALSKLTIPLAKATLTASDVAIVTGAPKPGAEIQFAHNGQPVVSRTAYGAGLVTLIGLDPTAEPVRDDPEQTALMKSIVKASQSRLPASMLEAQTLSQPVDEPSYRAGEVFITMPGEAETSHDPFHVKLPPFFEVAGILTAYFVLAIPVTFFVLRRARRLEWAWFTTPVLSVLFAFVFYLFTAELYKAGLAHRTSGVLTVSAGDAGAHFSGYSEMFFPRGGSYDIELQSGERLEEQAEGQGDYSYSSSTNPDRLETFDMLSGIAAPDYDVGNLSFRRFYYSQSVALGGPLTARLSYARNGVGGTVTNNTNLTLTDTCLVIPETKTELFLGTIAPGATKKINVGHGGPVQGSIALAQSVSQLLEPARNRKHVPVKYSAQQNCAWLTADLPSAGFGPQLGKDLSGNAGVVLLANLPIAGSPSGEGQ